MNAVALKKLLQGSQGSLSDVQKLMETAGKEGEFMKWLLSSLVGPAHEGAGSGTGEPSAVEQALRRPGTVDFQQLMAQVGKSKDPEPQDSKSDAADSQPDAASLPVTPVPVPTDPVPATPAKASPPQGQLSVTPPPPPDPQVVEDFINTHAVAVSE